MIVVIRSVAQAIVTTHERTNSTASLQNIYFSHKIISGHTTVLGELLYLYQIQAEFDLVNIRFTVTEFDLENISFTELDLENVRRSNRATLR